MKIGELARRTGLNASAIRYYEKQGILAPPDRTSGQRLYPGDAVHRVLLIVGVLLSKLFQRRQGAAGGN
jgi:DNA-binding transcriptional MerR regulator